MLALALLLLAIQDRQTIGPAPDDTPPPITLTAKKRCGSDPDEITVCGMVDQERYRIMRLEPRYLERPIRPEAALPGGGSVKAEAVQRDVGGVSAPAAMVTLRIPFGRKKKAPDPD